MKKKLCGSIFLNFAILSTVLFFSCSSEESTSTDTSSMTTIVPEYSIIKSDTITAEEFANEIYKNTIQNGANGETDAALEQKALNDKKTDT